MDVSVFSKIEFHFSIAIVGRFSFSSVLVLEFSDASLGPLQVIYPNPARNKVNIQLPDFDFQEGTVHIYNIFGQLIYTTSISQLNQGILSIDLDGFENGIYVMAIQVNGLSLVSRQFVVEHLE